MKKFVLIIAAALMLCILCGCGQQEVQYVTRDVEVEKIVEVPVEVEKIVEVPVEVEKIVEVPVEIEKIVEVPVEVEKITEVEKTVELTVEVEKIIEIPVEVEKIVEVTVEIEKIVEVPVEVEKIVEVPVEVEKIVEVPVEVEVIVEKEVVTELYETVDVPGAYEFSRRAEFEAQGIFIPEDFIAAFEDGTPVVLYGVNTYSVLRSHPDFNRAHELALIFFNGETGSPDVFEADPQRAECYGHYGEFILINYRGKLGWIKDTGLSRYGNNAGVEYILYK